MDNEKLNSLVTLYRTDRNDETFEELYTIVVTNWRRLDTVAKSVRSNEADILATYEDELMKCIDVYDGRGDFINLLNRYIWRKRRRIYTKKITLYKFESYEIDREDDDEGLATSEIKDEFNLEEHVIAKKRADQLALIDSLLKNADATTIGVVEAFLAHPKPTATAIAKELGVHHSKVTRALNRLAGKFSTKQFGNYEDYLIAL
jgi:hypothetical protein